MASPMWDVPEHLSIPLTVFGGGPAEGDDIDHWGCWCLHGDACPVVPRTKEKPDDR